MESGDLCESSATDRPEWRMSGSCLFNLTEHLSSQVPSPVCSLCAWAKESRVIIRKRDDRSKVSSSWAELRREENIQPACTCQGQSKRSSKEWRKVEEGKKRVLVHMYLHAAVMRLRTKALIGLFVKLCLMKTAGLTKTRQRIEQLCCLGRGSYKLTKFFFFLNHNNKKLEVVNFTHGDVMWTEYLWVCAIFSLNHLALCFIS